MVFAWTFHDPTCYSRYLSQGDNVTGIWIGQACQAFGVKQGTTVRHDQFAALESGKHALTGEYLTRRQNSTRKELHITKGKLAERTVSNRIPIYDFTISAPKSFSTALLIGQRSEILDWHQIAVEKTLAELERLTACTHKNGQRKVTEVTGNFCGARFTHFSNRSNDPALHSHVSICNATQSKDGKNYAIESSAWISKCAYLTSVYRDSLVSQAIRAGLEIEIDQYCAPQIKTVSDLNKKFSARSDDIQEMCECVEGVTGTRLKDSEKKRLCMQCRGINIPAFREIWARERDKLTIEYINDPNAEKARRRLLAAFEAIVRSCSEQEAPEVKQSVSLVDEWRKRLDPEELHRLMSLETGIAPPRCVTVEQAVNFAIRHCYERQSTAHHWQLETEALKYAQGANLNLDELRECVRSHSSLIHRGDSATTKDHYARECTVLKWVEEGHFQGAPLPKIKHTVLTDHQLLAVNELLSSPERFTCLIGRSGTGKTESTNALIEANIAMGYRVVALAPSVKARDVIKHLDRHTLQRFLIDKKEQAYLGKKDLVILDEAGFASFRQIHDLMALAIKNDWRVCFSGDPRQNVSVEAGDGMRVMLERTKLKREWLSDILRQKPDAMNGYYLMAARLFAQGKTTEAFSKLDRVGAIHEAQGQDRINAMADMYVEETEAGRSCICVNPSHEENDSLNEAIRERLQKKGHLGEEREITVHRSLGWTKAQRENLRDLRPGLVLEVTLGKQKGEVFEVRQVDQVRNVAYAVNSKGLRVKFDKASSEAFAVCERRNIKVAIGDILVTHSAMKVKKKEVMNGYSFKVKSVDPSCDIVSESGKLIQTKNLAHNYSSTSHRSQGESCDTVLVGFSRKSIAWATQKISYVAATRGKSLVRIFCESKLDLIQIEKKTGDRKSAVELIKFCIDLAKLKRHDHSIHIDKAA